MKISRKMLKRLVSEVLRERGTCTNYELMEIIEQRFGRKLTHNEKKRVTWYVKTHCNILEEDRRRENRTTHVIVIIGR